MKQRIVEVIAYLLEVTSSRVFESEDSSSDHDFIQEKLEDAGFNMELVADAFDWLKELMDQKSWCVSKKLDESECVKTFRIFNPGEQAKIDIEVRKFILSLECAGILNTKMREIVISQLMNLDQRLVDMIDAKWVVLLVLMSNSNKNSDDMRKYFLASMSLEK